RPAFLAALERPFLRSQSWAACISPPVSVSAALQSIMPAPVDSRRSLTIAAVIAATFVSAIVKVLLACQGRCGAATASPRPAAGKCRETRNEAMAGSTGHDLWFEHDLIGKPVPTFPDHAAALF